MILLSVVLIYILFVFYDMHLEENKEERLRVEELKELKETIEYLLEVNKELREGNQITEGEDELIMEMKNKKSLTELLSVKAEREDYEEYVGYLVDWIKDLYENYSFQLLKPNPNDFQSGYAIGLQLFSGEKPEVFDKMFKLAISKGLRDDEVNKVFIEQLKEGKVIPLGDAVLSTSSTGVSTILRGEDLQVFISFETEEYKAKRLEAEEADKKAREEQKEKQEAYIKQQKEIQKVLAEAASVLAQMTQEQLAENPEFEEKYREVNGLFR